MVNLLSLPCVIQHGCFIKWDFRSHSEEKYILWLIVPCGEYWSSIPRTVLRQRGIDLAPSYQGLTGTKLVNLTPQLPQRNMTKVLLAYRHCPATINFLHVPFKAPVLLYTNACCIFRLPSAQPHWISTCIGWHFSVLAPVSEQNTCSHFPKQSQGPIGQLPMVTLEGFKSALLPSYIITSFYVKVHRVEKAYLPEQDQTAGLWVAI